MPQARLLVLSNGHGEDQVAMRIVLQLLQLDAPPQITALPIVGEGEVYRRHQIPLLDAVQAMPSGGFIYMDGRQTLRDLQGGLGQLTWRQLREVRQWAKQGGTVLAVGDIVPLLFAWWSGAAYAFVGTAKSDYYLRDRTGNPLPQVNHPWWLSPSDYLPWERWLMRRPLCRAVFPRDPLTAQTLQRWPIPVFDLGNPMMDNLEPTGQLDRSILPQSPTLTVVLLPGSRAPEVYANWQLILDAVAGLCQTGEAYLFLAAIAPALDLAPIQIALHECGWTESREHTWQQGDATVVIAPGGFNDCVAVAEVAIAMAGTATEQCVGLGLPVVTFPGTGPQFTTAFAEAQTRLLGESIVMVADPKQINVAVQAALKLSRNSLQTNGQQRMGTPGVSQRIAQCLQAQLLSQSGSVVS